MSTRQKGIKWDLERIPPLTNFFAEDIKGRQDRPTEDIINILMDDDARINVFWTYNGLTKWGKLNNGSKINQNIPFEVKLFLWPGMTYNFQHTDNSQINVAVFIITEVVE